LAANLFTTKKCFSLPKQREGNLLWFPEKRRNLNETNNCYELPWSSLFIPE
jgi:hypothetical protein